MGARGKAVVVACSPMGHVLAYAADGEHFQEIPVPEAANMVAAAITPDKQLVAVGSNDLMVLASPERGRVIATSEVGRRWLDVMALARAEKQQQLHTEQPEQVPAEP
jgi:hypothetical protein